MYTAGRFSVIQVDDAFNVSNAKGSIGFSTSINQFKIRIVGKRFQSR